MPHRAFQLAKTPLFQTHDEGLPFSERIRISHDKAKAVLQLYSTHPNYLFFLKRLIVINTELTKEDILNASPKYWEFHSDPICTMDLAAGTLLTIHYNLCCGTLAKFAQRPDVDRTLQDLLSYKLSYVCHSSVPHNLFIDPQIEANSVLRNLAMGWTP